MCELLSHWVRQTHFYRGEVTERSVMVTAHSGVSSLLALAAAGGDADPRDGRKPPVVHWLRSSRTPPRLADVPPPCRGRKPKGESL
jgi:hypothetical protein